MATDKRGVSEFPHVFEQATTNAVWVEVQLPSQCNQVCIISRVHPAHIGFNDCTDGGAVSDAVSFDVPKDEIFTVKLGRGNSRNSSIFFSTDGGDTTIKVILIE